MNTIIDSINNSFTVSDRVKAAQMVEVVRWGLFGAYHYKVGKYKFEQKKLGTKQFSPSFWYVTTNGKTMRIKYKYVLYLTMKTLGFIE